MKNLSKLAKTSLCTLTLSLATFSAFATPTVYAPTACNTNDFLITSMTRSDGTGGSIALPPTGNLGGTNGLAATKCVGLVDGNSSGGTLQSPSPNLGWRGDGFMNGGVDGQGNTRLTGDEFITVNSPLQALKDPNKAVDPGWIHLGQIDGGAAAVDGARNMVADDVGVGETAFNLGSMVQFSLRTDGTWTFTTAADIVQQLKDKGFNNRTYFDQFAIVAKQADHTTSNDGTSGGGWAVYDFNFADLLAQALTQGPAPFDLSVPYSFSGVWNLTEFTGNGLSFSHMDIWARDPIGTNSVPVPGTVLLVGLGLLALGYSRKKATAAQA